MAGATPGGHGVSGAAGRRVHPGVAALSAGRWSEGRQTDGGITNIVKARATRRRSGVRRADPGRDGAAAVWLEFRRLLAERRADGDVRAAGGGWTDGRPDGVGGAAGSLWGVRRHRLAQHAAQRAKLVGDVAGLAGGDVPAVRLRADA